MNVRLHNFSQISIKIKFLIRISIPLFSSTKSFPPSPSFIKHNNFFKRINTLLMYLSRLLLFHVRLIVLTKESTLHLRIKCYFSTAASRAAHIPRSSTLVKGERGVWCIIFKLYTSYRLCVYSLIALSIQCPRVLSITRYIFWLLLTK